CSSANNTTAAPLLAMGSLLLRARLINALGPVRLCYLRHIESGASSMRLSCAVHCQRIHSGSHVIFNMLSPRTVSIAPLRGGKFINYSIQRVAKRTLYCHDAVLEDVAAGSVANATSVRLSSISSWSNNPAIGGRCVEEDSFRGSGRVGCSPI